MHKETRIAAFQGMHVPPAKHSYVRPRKVWLPRSVTTGQNYLCFAGNTKSFNVYHNLYFLLLAGIVNAEMLHLSGGGRVVKLLACGARGSIPGVATWISEIGYLLLPSRDMAEIPLKRRKCSIKPTNQPTFLLKKRFFF